MVDIKKITVQEIESFVEDAGSDNVRVFGGKFEGGLQIQQVPDEIAPCISAIMESGRSVNSYLEIGAAAGGTTALMNHFLKPVRTVLIDDNKHPKHHVRPYILRDVPHNEIIGDSHSQETIARLFEMNTLFDVILIDGDHSYEGCKLDVENYKPFLRSGGFLIFHDSSCRECWGVNRVVTDCKSDPDISFVGEYITQKHSHPCGVALFRKGINENK